AGNRVEPAGRLQRAPVVRGRVDVRVRVAGVTGGQARVVPRAFVVVSLEEVERQVLGFPLGVGAGEPLDRLAGSEMQLAAAAVREALVGGVTEHGMAKARRILALEREEPF